MTDHPVDPARRFPHYRSTPVSYRRVAMRDGFWEPRQAAARDVSVRVISAAHDRAGGLDALEVDPDGYVADHSVRNMEAIKFLEGLATVIGTRPDASMEALAESWSDSLLAAQNPDGYLLDGFPGGLDRVPERWHPVTWSHEDYTIGHYIEAAIAYRDATGRTRLFDSAVRAADNMADEVLDGARAYTSGHPEIEQALTRLYGETGNDRYLRLCGWLLDQRGRHESRSSYGRAHQDAGPITEQRTIQGHAVMAAYLYNGVVEYVAATGDPAYREAVLAVWDDLEYRRMYTHGASGNRSSRIEGYRKDPYCILPDDVYGESCSVIANFRWAHSLARLTGEARYLDAAERMLYNALPGSVSLDGGHSVYCNIALADGPTPRLDKPTSCCPPNIVKIVSTISGYLYSTDADGILVNHYGASVADIPWADGVRITQETEYPWDGRVVLTIEPGFEQGQSPSEFALRLRLPAWASVQGIPSYGLAVNDEPVAAVADAGWLSVRRRWEAGDRVTLDLPMEVRRVLMPPEFREYFNRASLERGPVVYCLEDQDLGDPSESSSDPVAGFMNSLAVLYIPEDEIYTAEHVPDVLGGVTVLRGRVRALEWRGDGEYVKPATFVPYAVWNNREPGAMRIWLGAYKTPLVELLLPEFALGESCVG